MSLALREHLHESHQEISCCIHDTPAMFDVKCKVRESNVFPQWKVSGSVGSVVSKLCTSFVVDRVIEC